jgi:lipid II:glycine glycyltransferase (peptidoglycan interpeptide bridge formation enzyme)
MANTVSPLADVSGFSVRVDSTDVSEWSELLCQFDDASVYQTWAYGAVHWGEHQLSHLVLERNSKAISIAQVRIVKLPVIGKGIAYVRWGPVCRRRSEPYDPDVLRQMTQALREEYVNRRGLMLRLVPPVYTSDTFAESWAADWASAGIVRNGKIDPEHTMRVDLSPTLDILRSKLHQRWRNYLKSAEKEGFTVHDGTSVEFYDKFLAAYNEMMSRKRFDTTVDVNEFRRIQAELPEQLRMRVFLAEKEGKLFNALVVAAAGDTGIYLLAATSDEGLKSKGAHLLQWRAMEWLKANGFHRYELGGINPEKNPGVFQFKNGLGGEDVHQIGVFESSGSPLSAACVRAGERLQATARRLKRWTQNGSE